MSCRNGLPQPVGVRPNNVVNFWIIETIQEALLGHVEECVDEIGHSGCGVESSVQLTSHSCSLAGSVDVTERNQGGLGPEEWRNDTTSAGDFNNRVTDLLGITVEFYHCLSAIGINPAAPEAICHTGEDF